MAQFVNAYRAIQYHHFWEATCLVASDDSLRGGIYADSVEGVGVNLKKMKFVFADGVFYF